MPDNISIVQHGYEAHKQGDVPAVFALLHADFEIVQTPLLPWGGHYRGLAQAGEFFGRLNAHVEAQVEPLEFIEAGEQVAVFGRLRGTARASGRTFDMKIVHIWTLKEGKATKFEAYINTPAMQEALGITREKS